MFPICNCADSELREIAERMRCLCTHCGAAAGNHEEGARTRGTSRMLRQRIREGVAAALDSL